MAMEGTIKIEPESYEEDESTFSIDISETMSLVEMERRCVKQEVGDNEELEVGEVPGASDDNGKRKGGKLPPGGSSGRSSAEHTDESRKEAIEKARKWYEDYMGNRKLRRKKQEHRAANPNPVSFECPVCLRMFQYESKLVYHIPFCVDLKLFKCRTQHCDKRFRNLSQARLHYQRCHRKLTV